MSSDVSEVRLEGAMREMAETIRDHRGRFMFLGVALIVLGILAIAFPLLTTIAVKVLLGWLFLIGGLVQVFHAFSTKRWSQFLYNLLIGLLYVFVGAWLAFLPLTGILSLTILLALMFILQGVLQAMVGLAMKPLEGWIWMLVAGIVAIVAGVMLIAGLPGTATWAIGLLVGISMISSGWAYLLTALRSDRVV